MQDKNFEAEQKSSSTLTPVSAREENGATERENKEAAPVVTTAREEGAKEPAAAEQAPAKKAGFFSSVAHAFRALGRWLKRLFLGGSRTLAMERTRKTDGNATDVEPIVSPGKQMLKAFFSKPRAVIALGVLVAMFLLVFIGPLANPYDPSYVEVTQQNVKPGLFMMKVPKALESDVKEISSYSRFSVGLSNAGKVYAWGATEGFNYDIAKIPTDVQNERIVHVAAGYDHAIAISEDGQVYGWGHNELGQYGKPPANGAAAMLYTWAPKAVLDGFSSGDVVKEVVCGYQMTAIVMTDGTYYAWGNTNVGAVNWTRFKREVKEKLDVGVGVDSIRFTAANVVALMQDGSVVTASDAYRYIRNSDGVLVEFSEYVAENNLKFSDLATTSNTVALITTEGKAKVIGSITKGEDAVPKLADGVRLVSVEGGLRHYTALASNGRVYSWGSNEWKQTKVPKRLTGTEKIFVGPFQNYAVGGDDEILDKWGLKGYAMGTDGFGRCVWNRILNGGRMTMTIGAIAVIISSIIGVVIGCLSGYFGGWVDMILMRITEIVSAIPFLPFAMILSVIVQVAGIGETMRIVMMMVILGLLSWTGLARLVRGQVLAEREKEFVLAAKAMGVKESKIAFKHILPNVISIIIVSMTLDFASCMLTESSLSYLGFGVRGSPTWGNMLTNANNSIVIQNYYWQWIFPALFLAITTICINMIGDALRDIMDPKSNSEK